MGKGTEKRKRNHVLTARFNDQEAAAIEAMADRSGLSIGSLIRRALLNTPPPRAIRRPPVEAQAVARLLGEFGKIGSNVNQIAKHLNAGRPGDTVENTIVEALRAFLELRLACLQALGQEPRRRPPDPED